MGCGFRPHDRDRTTESMEGVRMGFGPVWMGYWAVVKRCWATKRREFRATRLTVGASNDLQMRRKLTGGLPVIYQGRLANLGPFQECLTPAHEKRQVGCAGAFSPLSVLQSGTPMSPDVPLFSPVVSGC